MSGSPREGPPTSESGAPAQSPAREINRPLAADQHDPIADPDIFGEVDVEVLEHVLALLGQAVTYDSPSFASAEWFRLDHRDPRRQASLVLAAAAWWASEHGLGLPLSPERLDREVARELKAASAAISSATDWSVAARESRYVAAAMRRREEALGPRPADHDGGSVSWSAESGVERAA